MKLTASSAIGALAVIAASVVSNVTPAGAVQLSADTALNIGGNVDVIGTGQNGQFDFLRFTAPTAGPTPGQFAVLGTSGSFSGLGLTVPPNATVGAIKDLIAGQALPADFITAPEGSPSLTFDLKEVTLPAVITDNTLGGASATIGFKGVFNGIAGFDETPGQANFSADFPNINAAQLTALLASGGRVDNVSYSARFVVTPTAVPESSATPGLLALGVIGGVVAATKRKRSRLTFN